MNNIAQSIFAIRHKIQDLELKYQRPAESVKLLAVSKTKPVESVREAMAAGQVDFGENYVQEAIRKINQINHPGLGWHFIGPVQSNKTRTIAQYFQWVHSIDRDKIAQRLNDNRPENLPPLNICLQVNVSDEQSKSGVKLSELEKLAEFCSTLPRLKLCGLMALPAICDDFEQQRIPFKKMRDLLTRLQADFPAMETLSMGTTHDMEAAIAEGSTIVRIGSAIFGARS